MNSLGFDFFLIVFTEKKTSIMNTYQRKFKALQNMPKPKWHTSKKVLSSKAMLSPGAHQVRHLKMSLVGFMDLTCSTQLLIYTQCKSSLFFLHLSVLHTRTHIKLEWEITIDCPSQRQKKCILKRCMRILWFLKSISYFCWSRLLRINASSKMHSGA